MALTKVTMGLLSGLVDKITTTVRSLFNVSGDAPMYTCRAWVNFDGNRDTAGNVSSANTARFIRASGNVSSVVKNSLGDYTINITSPLIDAAYSVFGSAGSNGTIADEQLFVWQKDVAMRTPSSFKIVVTKHGTAGGWGPVPSTSDIVDVAVFR